MNKFITTSATLALCLSAPFVYAQKHTENMLQHQAHVHGQVQLNIAQDEGELLIEVVAPGSDVVGFEHAPSNAEQAAKLSAAIAQLEQANSLWQLPNNAQCKLNDVTVETHGMAPDAADDHTDHHDHAQHKDHDAHEHHGDKHSDKHDDKHDHADHHAHDHDQSQADQHGEFHANYHYQCSNPKALNQLDVRWFTYFPQSQTLQVAWLSAQGQTALTLKASDGKSQSISHP
ncbi:hypothetical protein VST7929_00369 [Vibrio stylophorae]|uniref:DUF2796 domain-containing protein n=1 Tax=Vibrio stylophorae TaxID=659351 RepID=A0ABN8DN35_9VIBR|nr:DUF2796 domain-containing protein [Vibrio stylophorae]CAH0532539.1 hypothetical protein VST7929_00369 [Vibrio stylophorae]